MRLLRRHSRMGQVVLEELFRASSLGELAELTSQRELRPGSPFRITMRLNESIAHAFDLAGAEAIFRPVMPPGLTLVDVHSPDNKRTVVLDSRVDVEQAQGAKMRFPVVIAAIGAFIATHWVGLSLAVIGITAALGFLVASIRGEGVALVSAFGDIAKFVVIGIAGLLVLEVARGGSRRVAA